MACDSPYLVMPRAGTQKVPVPCGKCPACKIRRVNQWVFRLMQEEKRAVTSYFVTLTYDTSTVPISKHGFMTLRKKDVQDFMKRLRKLEGYALDPPIKYYAAGEYGTNNGRPHYHLILMNVRDVKNIAKAWELSGNSIGIVHVGSVSGPSIAYTCKYIDKAGIVKRHARDDRAKEFSLMSKGIGSTYITPESMAYHKADLTRMYVTNPGGIRVSMPKYYRDKMYTESERKKYVAKIETILADQRLKDYKQFTATRPGATMEDFLASLDSARFGRHYKFINQSKPRKL